MTLALDAATMKEIKRHPEIRWSEVARQAFEAKLQRLKLIDELDAAFANSKVDDKDIARWSKAAKERILKDFLELRGDAARR